MEVLVGVLAAVAGAVAAYTLPLRRERRQARTKVAVAIRAELTIALGLADEVLAKNKPFMDWLDHETGGSWPRCEFTVFPTAAWTGAISGGGIGELSFETIEAASRAHAATLRANYVAEKIQLTGFKTEGARQYNELVMDLRGYVEHALAHFS